MQTTQNDEIDLLEFLAKLVLILRKNLKSLLLAFVIGTLLGLAYYQFTPKTYESKMIILSDILTASYSERLTENLNSLIEEKNKTLSERLGIPVEMADKIVKMKIESLQGKQSANVSESSTFLITVTTLDNSIFPQLQEALISYMRNNEFVKIRVRQRQDFYKSMIEKVGQEIRSLDSLKTRLFKGQPIYSKSAEMLLIDPTSIYSKIIELTKTQIDYKNALELVNSIQLVEGFTVFEKPVSPKLSISLAAGASFGVFVVILIMAFKGIRKMIRFSEQKLANS